MTKRRVNYRHYICAAITVGFILLTVFAFPNALARLIESVRDFSLSIAYYFCELCGIQHSITPTVTTLPELTFTGSLPSTGVADTWSGAKSDFVEYWRLWVNINNFTAYNARLGSGLYILLYILLFALPVVLVIVLAVKLTTNKPNNAYNRDSVPLKAFKTLTKPYKAVKQWCIDFYGFVRDCKAWRIVWLIIWLFNFNVITIIIEFIAFYFYFTVSFDVNGIWRQIHKLFLDLSVPFKFIPVWVWVIIGLVLFDKFRKNIALSRLRHMELRNRGFINARPIVYMVCGTMGKKKTTAITDMALSQEVMLRDKALEKLLETDLQFPYFPYVNLENELKRVMRFHHVYNLATVQKWVEKKFRRWYYNRTKQHIFGYDYERYGLSYNDELQVINVWQAIAAYAQLYFIYIIKSSLMISNYSIRTDAILSDLGNFPLWNTDFFGRDSRLIDSFSRHSHIIDFDALRLGKKVIENNPQKDFFEFGVTVITEVGKERGNMLTTKARNKKDSETANQDNDLFNSWLKMIRHSATVANFPFVKVITDEQRAESLGADARCLAEIVHITDSGELKLAMPFFSLGELLHAFVMGKFKSTYLNYRFIHGDNTLLMYLLKSIAAKVEHYYKHIYNRFGFVTLGVQVEQGTQDGAVENNTYYLMSKKIYSKRFSTDCFSEYFADKALRSPVGLDDIPEYDTEKATFAEMQQQNSYFIIDLTKSEIQEVQS